MFHEFASILEGGNFDTQEETCQVLGGTEMMNYNNYIILLYYQNIVINNVSLLMQINKMFLFLQFCYY